VTGSRLGFGCSALVGGRTRREATNLLEVALDAGITHFDVARAYGSGDAEAYLGAFAAGRRKEVTLTTKFGIDPIAANPASAGVKRMIRVATRRSQRLRGLVRRHSSASLKRGLFSPQKARASLETSLRNLGTDHVDFFMMHDCTRADWEQDNLQATLDALRSDGIIRSYGPATTFAEVTAILGGSYPHVEVAQFESDAYQPNTPPQNDTARKQLTITHGCFRDGLPRLLELAEARPDAARDWSRRLGVDMSSAAELAGLLLAAALQLNPGGIVLFSSGDARRIEQNARVARESPYEPSQVAEFLRLVGSHVRRG
jgi:D-threo-aldose 1-dehydrogenase